MHVNRLLLLTPPASRIKAAAVAACAVLTTGCLRTVWVNELDVPGLCPPETPHHPAAEIAVEQWPTAPALFGLVWDARTGQPIPGATVRLDTPTPQPTVTDSRGMFVMGNVPVGWRTLTVLMLGYHTRTDTLLVRDRSVLRPSIPLELATLDGRCSGMASVPVRRWTWPWSRSR